MSICNYATMFKGLSSINEDLLLNIIEANFKMFLDWSFLNIGAWIDVQKPTSTIYGGNKHYKLLLVDDPAYEDGQVWQGVRKDWVWENCINYNSSVPIAIDQVLLNNSTVVPKTNNFIVNYPLGRIIFYNAIPVSSIVEADYSYRLVQVHRSVDAPWFNIIQYNSFNTDNADIQRSSDGDWSIGSNHRIQLPAVIIESVARSRSRPFEIGSNSLIMEQDIAFHILAENKNDRNKILDILRLQQDSIIWLYNTNVLAQDDKYPLDYNGDLKSSPLMYPNIIDQYKWRKCWIKNVGLFEIDSFHPNMHRGMVRATLEIISE